MSSRSAFTLVELLIVIAIIGVLITSLIVLINPATQLQKARDAERKSDLHQIKNALELYYQNNNRYPLTDAEFDAIDGNGFGTAWSGYMSKIPNDPLGSQTGSHGPRHYQYLPIPNTNRQEYCLYANLERSDDPNLCNNGAVCPGVLDPGPLAQHCGQDATKPCNYGICSSNRTP